MELISAAGPAAGEPDSSEITTVDALISISESSANPASAIDRAETVAADSTTIPGSCAGREP